jgi:hypothetical protein
VSIVPTPLPYIDTLKKYAMKMRQRKIVATVAVIAALALLVVGALRSAGFVLDGAYIVKGATVRIENTAENTQVFLDQKRRGKVGSAGTFTINNVTGGEHNIIAAHPASWPWVETISTTNREEVALEPLLIAREPEGAALTTGSEAFRNAAALLNTAKVPTPQHPLRSLDDSALVWFDGTTIITRTSAGENQTLRPRDTVRALLWYPHRNDALIVAAGNRIFVLGIKPGNPQNFFPVYDGVAPTFAISETTDNTLLVKDGENILLLSLSVN